MTDRCCGPAAEAAKPSARTGPRGAEKAQAEAEKQQQREAEKAQAEAEKAGDAANGIAVKRRHCPARWRRLPRAAPLVCRASRPYGCE